MKRTADNASRPRSAAHTSAQARQWHAERTATGGYRSLSHIYAQVIDDVARKTIASASDVEADSKGEGLR